MDSREYETKMLEAYIATPSKVIWYAKAFQTLDRRSKGVSWYWNSWAMIGGFWYLLYRKQMKVALIILFIILIVGAIVPLPFFILFYLLLSLLLGGFSTYFVYTNYKLHRKDIEVMFEGDKEKSIGVMRIVAGVNSVALYAGVFAFVSLLLITIGLLIMAKGSLPL